MHFFPHKILHVTSCPPISMSPDHADIYHSKTPHFLWKLFSFNKCSRSVRSVHQGSGDRDSVSGKMFQQPFEGLVQFLRLVAADLTLTIAAVLCIILKQILKHEENCQRPTL